ncbi:hypothetical protein NUU61_004492 [Penicillium alfredii]|uniref:Uncharacterized protein n=1 Tax=Penicillium alfredii TaxID=1506179 RepID=A0A9W9KDB6_9EURO|nr:uncharacterized protein NUU61_004492 [Penicillium alfredii]KAJ5102270.1 hypothetical protein NUU61_004492 [Penicillium alfredii]
MSVFVKIVHPGLVYPFQDEENGNPFASPQPPLRKQKRNMLLEELMNIKDTVEHLSIGFDLCPLRYGTFWDEYGDIEPALMPFRGFLKEFPRLRMAEVPAVMLFGWVYSNAPNIAELLPTTLQRLSLRENMSLVDGYQWELGNIARAIQLFLLRANTATPLLKTITMRASGVGEKDNYGQEQAAAA